VDYCAGVHTAGEEGSAGVSLLSAPSPCPRCWGKWSWSPTLQSHWNTAPSQLILTNSQQMLS